MTTPADPLDVIYRQLMHWPLPPVQVADDIIAALDAAGYTIVPKTERPSVCPKCGSRAPIYALKGSDCDPMTDGNPDPWHGGAE